MSRNLTAAFAVVLGLVGGLPSAATNANALGTRHPCEHCAATSTTRIFRTIHPLLHVTRYHDRSVYHHVTRLHYVVEVTRIQPIIHIDDVTRVHHFTVVQDAYADQPATLAPAPDGEPAPGYASGCGCME